MIIDQFGDRIIINILVGDICDVTRIKSTQIARDNKGKNIKQ